MAATLEETHDEPEDHPEHEAIDEHPACIVGRRRHRKEKQGDFRNPYLDKQGAYPMPRFDLGDEADPDKLADHIPENLEYHKHRLETEARDRGDIVVAGNGKWLSEGIHAKISAECGHDRSYRDTLRISSQLRLLVHELSQ